MYFELLSTWYLLLCCNNTHKVLRGLSVNNQSSKIFLYGILSFQYSLFVPSVDFSSVELNKLVRPIQTSSVPGRKCKDAEICSLLGCCGCNLGWTRFLGNKKYWVMISACLCYQNLLFLFYVSSFRSISVAVLKFSANTGFKILSHRHQGDTYIL